MGKSMPGQVVDALAKAKVHGVKEVFPRRGIPEALEDRRDGIGLFERIKIAFQELIRGEIFGLEYDMVGVIEGPIAAEDAALLGQTLVQPGARIRSENGKIGYLQLGLEHKVQGPVKYSRIIGVEAEDKRPVDANAVVVYALDHI